MGIFSAECSSLARLDGKTAIITGCNTGIGKATVKDFFSRGARVVMACRNVQKANEAMRDIKQGCRKLENVGDIVVTELNLSSLKSVRQCATHLLQSEKRIDLLVNNAGVMMCPLTKTEDGNEMQFGTNHLGHFLLTLLLLPKICQSTPARIVTVSSSAHTSGHIDFSDLNWEKRTYGPMGAYRQSKLANLLFSNELARRLKENNIEGVTTYSLHPGVIRTDIGRHLGETSAWGVKWAWETLAGWFVKTPEQGAQTTIYCSVDEKCANESGLYYAECAIKKPATDAQNEEIARQLWEESLKLVGLKESFNPFKAQVS